MSAKSRFLDWTDAKSSGYEEMSMVFLSDPPSLAEYCLNTIFIRSVLWSHDNLLTSVRPDSDERCHPCPPLVGNTFWEFLLMYRTFFLVGEKFTRDLSLKACGFYIFGAWP